MKIFFASVLLVSLSWSLPARSAVTLTELEYLLPEDYWGYGYAISHDGSVVVGEVGGPWVNGVGHEEGFLWTAHDGVTGMGQIGTAPGIWSYAEWLSADGSIAVGEAQGDDGEIVAFRWTRQGGMEALPTLPNAISISVVSASSNAGVIAGN